MNILFVCTGNTCRSPMCEGFFRTLCARKGNTLFRCSSAGIAASDGEKMSPNAAEVLRNEGIDPEFHRSRPLTKEIAEAADLVIALTENHRRRILAGFPFAAEKVRLLGEYSFPDSPRDVADPFGGSPAIYQQCFSEMKTHLENLYAKLTDSKI